MALRLSLDLKSNVGSKLSNIGGSVLDLGKKFVKFGAIGSLAIAGLSVKVAGDFSKGLAEVTTLMDDLTQVQIKNMGKELMNLAASTGLALNSLTKAKYDVVSAGFSDAAESAIVLNEAAKLAVGGVTTAAAAADLLTTALNAYGKSASEAADVADILFTTVKLGKTTMTELSASMGQMLPMARAAKVALADISAALAVVTANGIGTAEATTSINAALTALTAGSPEAKAEMEKLGIEVKRFDDGSMDLVSTMKQFAGMDPEALKNLIPSRQAIKTVLILANDTDTLSSALETMEDRAGAAGKAAEKMNAEWNTSMAKLKNNIQNGLISIGEVIIAKLKPVVDDANAILQRIGEIGWGEVAKQFADNWSAILTFLYNILDAWVGTVANRFRKMILDIVMEFDAFFRIVAGMALGFTDEWIANLDKQTSHQEMLLTNSMAAFKVYTDYLIAQAAKSAAVDPTPKPSAAESEKKDAEDKDARVEKEATILGKIRTMRGKENQIQLEGFVGTQSEIFQMYAADLETKAQKFTDFTNLVGSAGDALLTMRKQQIATELEEDIARIEKQKAAIDEKLKADIAAVLISNNTEKQKAAMISNLEAAALAQQQSKAQQIKDLKQKAVDDERAFAKQLKPIRVAQAIAEGALLVIKAAQTQPFVPLGIAAMALAGVVAGANIATVIAQPFARGGNVMPMATGGSVPASDVVPALLRPREIVSTPEANDQFGGEITRMNQLSSGGGGGERSVIVNITAVDGESVYRVIVNNKAEFAKGFIELVGSGHLPIGSIS